jgi:hypothetical protein
VMNFEISIFYLLQARYYTLRNLEEFGVGYQDFGSPPTCGKAEGTKVDIG